MASQKKRKIKVVTIHDNFFKLFDDNSDPELLTIKEEMHRRPCLVLIKIKYKNKKYTFALPLRSNISYNAPKNTYFALPTRSTTRDGNHHGIHYSKAFPVDSKYFLPYQMDGDFFGELVLATIEKNIKIIVQDFQKYIERYENGDRPKFCTDIDNAIVKQELIK